MRRSNAPLGLAHIAIAGLCFLGNPVFVRSDFHRGDLVPTSRRAQFHGERTNWHDLFARHCALFGKDGAVAVPLPKPVGLKEHDTYKIQLSFDHDRHVTGWLTLIDKTTRDGYAVHLNELETRKQKARVPLKKVRGNGGGKKKEEEADYKFDRESDFDAFPPFVPSVSVFLTRGDGGEIKYITAEIRALPSTYLKSHRKYVRTFHNETDWPKHVLVVYKWRTESAVSEGWFLGWCLCVFSVAIFFSVKKITLDHHSGSGDVKKLIEAFVAGETRKQQKKDTARGVRSKPGGKRE